LTTLISSRTRLTSPGNVKCRIRKVHWFEPTEAGSVWEKKDNGEEERKTRHPAE